jgi:hypothetical protein
VKVKIIISVILICLISQIFGVESQRSLLKKKVDSIVASESGTAYYVNDNRCFIYRNNKPFSFLTNIPYNYTSYCKKTFRKDNLWNIAGMVGITSLFVYLDQPIIDEAQRFGRKINVSGHDNTKTFISIDGLNIFRGPTDLGSSLYFLGDGWFHFSIAGGFLISATITKDSRAMNTGVQLVEGIITSGSVSQLLKHITGRQSPFKSTQDGGKWNWLPNQFEYSKHVPAYDAFPSGHLTSAMTVYTIIAENYPEYLPVIRPVAYTLMGALSFQMLNNGVHWFSDYPLALALGHTFGEIVVHHNRIDISNKYSQKKNKIKLSSGILNSGDLGLFASYSF